jgi:hypothetical protein
MNKIPQPPYDDAAALASLAANPDVASYPHLIPLIPTIQSAYTQYTAAGGNAFNVALVPLAHQVSVNLRKNYKSPNKDLTHITSMRKETEHKPCPMCGSFHSGTLDHLLPKNTYAAFAIFSKNLVPACKCNSKRKETLTGPLANQRILHPYFDNCLAERLIGADFTALGPVPLVKIKLQVPATHPEYAAIDFHVQSIVEESAIKNWLIARWAKLCRKPSLVVRELKTNPASLVQLQDILARERDELDESYESKNNWESVFITGLLEPSVTAWIYSQMTKLGRLPNEPLV